MSRELVLVRGHGLALRTHGATPNSLVSTKAYRVRTPTVSPPLEHVHAI